MHVSTAFVNCVDVHSNEMLHSHNLSIDCDTLLKLKTYIGDEEFNSMTKNLLRKYPNTYSFTKALAEQAVLRHGKTLPICILRPGVGKCY